MAHAYGHTVSEKGGYALGQAGSRGRVAFGRFAATEGLYGLMILAQLSACMWCK